MRTILALGAAAVLAAAGCKKSSSASPPPPPPPPAALSVTSITPAQGPLAGNTAVQVGGTGFLAGATVTIGGTLLANGAVATGSLITGDTPAGAIGPADVVVTNPPSDSVTLVGGFLYQGGVPSISGITPSTTPQGGGSVITINGANFYTGATVTVAGVACTGVTVNAGNNQIICTTQSMVPFVGPVTVVVTNLDTQSVSDTTSLSLTGPAPTLTVIAPTAGPAAGGTTLYLSGSGFAPGATVTVGGSSATVVSNLPTSLVVTTPIGTGGTQATIQVTNPDLQSASLTNAFTYWGTPPSINAGSLTPTSGPNSGGTTITLTGSDFNASAVLEVGGIACTSVAVTGTNPTMQIVGTTQAINQFGFPMLGPVNVAVVNPDGQAATLTNAFTALGSTPTVSSIAPTSGSTGGGTIVTITGTNFDPILDGSVTTSTVTFGGTTCPTITVTSSTQIVVYTPPGTGTAGVTVTNADGLNGSLASAFTYNTGPGLTSVSPSSGPVAGNTAVTLTGTGFAAGDTVAFNGVAASAVVIGSATQITCTTPAGVLGPVDVTVTSSGAVSSSRFNAYTYRNGVNTQTAVYTWDTSTGIDCRSRFYLDMNVPSFLKDLQNRGLQTWGTPGDTSAPPANPALVDQYALDWMRAYVLRTINIVYGRNPNGTKISGQSINITFTGLPPATGSPGCAAPATDFSHMYFGGYHPSGCGGHPIASQTGCNNGILGRAQFDNADSIPCNSYAEITGNSVYQGCTNCAVHNGVFTSLIGGSFGTTLATSTTPNGPNLQAGDQQYLDGTTNSGARYNDIHNFLQAFARRIAFVAAHEIGHTLGLSANGAAGPCTITLSPNGQCGATPGHNNCCGGNLMGQSINVGPGITYTDYTEGLSGNPDPSNPARAASCSVTGQSSWAVLQAYLGLSP